jgi:hypothetical protein
MKTGFHMNLMNLRLAFVVVGIMAALSATREARASRLLRIDDVFWGPNSIVHDTATGSDWLPPIDTVNQSYNTVVSNSGADDYTNFQYATLTDVDNLLADADLSDTSDYNWRFRATALLTFLNRPILVA